MYTILPHPSQRQRADEALVAMHSYFERARALLRTAQTDEEHETARFALANASQEIARWQEILNNAAL